MSLKDAINNTNTQKENVKKVANKIDNKLVELGGEQATDLFDVPNKIGIMIKNNYKKVATGIYSSSLSARGANTNREEVIKSIPINIDFIPTKVFISSTNLTHDGKRDMINFSLNSEKNNSVSTATGYPATTNHIGHVYIKAISNTSIDVAFLVVNRSLTISGPIAWIAIG